MNRALVVGFATLFPVLLAGCTTESNEGLISNTIGMMDSATTEIKNIRVRVKDATEKAKADPNLKLDLTEATEAAKKLKVVSDDAMKLKRDIERSRAKITEAEKKTYAENQKVELNTKFKALLEAQTDLRRQLAEAETISDNARVEVDKLREKIQQAQSPFEAMAR